MEAKFSRIIYKFSETEVQDKEVELKHNADILQIKLRHTFSGNPRNLNYLVSNR